MKEDVQKETILNGSNREIGGRQSKTGDGRIAGQRMQKDSATTQLFKASNENFAELFNHVLPSEIPLLAGELHDEDIKETYPGKSELLQQCFGKRSECIGRADAFARTYNAQEIERGKYGRRDQCV